MNPLLLGGLVDMGKSLIDRVFPDKVKQAAERVQAELQLEAMRQDGALKAQAVQLSAIIAEAQSPDPWTSRARPSYMYVMYVMMLSSIPMGVLFAFRPEVATSVTEGVKLWLAAIPEEMWWAFGAGYLGYTGARSFEKAKKVTK